MDNYQALAYVTLALRDLGFDHDTIGKVRRKMLFLFDTRSETEAEELAAFYLREVTR